MTLLKEGTFDFLDLLHIVFGVGAILFQNHIRAALVQTAFWTLRPLRFQVLEVGDQVPMQKYVASVSEISLSLRTAKILFVRKESI